MPAIMEQVSRLGVSEKLDLMECILKSIGMSVAAEPVKPVRTSRIGICRGMCTDELAYSPHPDDPNSIDDAPEY